MRRTSTAITTAVMIATGLTMGLLPTGIARAGEGSDVQELRREVSRMRAEVQAMSVAIMQANELERHRTAKLTKALEEQAAARPGRPAPVSPGRARRRRRGAGRARAHAAGRARLGRQRQG